MATTLVAGLLPAPQFAATPSAAAFEAEAATTSADIVLKQDDTTASRNAYIEFPADSSRPQRPANTDPTVIPPTLPNTCRTNNVIAPNPGTNLTSLLQNLDPGDTVELAPGNYRINNGAVFTNSGTQADPICVLARDQPIRQDAAGLRQGNVVIRAGGSIRFSDAQYWRIQGLDFATRSIQLLGTSADTPFHFELLNNFHTTPNGGGDTIIFKNAEHIAIRDSIFSYVRSNKLGKDRHALTILNESGYIEYTDNVCENVSADCIQSQGNQSKSAGQVHDVLVADSVMRINRPHPLSTGGEPFCNTGENGLDIKIGRDWIVRNNLFSGYQQIVDCVDFESSSNAGEAIVLHKSSGLNFLIEDNVFENNSEHILIHGKTCTARGRNCSGPQGSENITIRGNVFDNTAIADGENISGITITPGYGANARGLGPLQFKVSKDVLVERNTFSGSPIAVNVIDQTEFLYGQDQVETYFVNGTVTTFDPAPDGVARPTGTTIDRNIIDGGIVQFSDGVECFGNQCPTPSQPIDCSPAGAFGQATHTQVALPAGDYLVWARVKTAESNVTAGVRVESESAAEVYCEPVSFSTSDGQWAWVQAASPLVWTDTDADITVLGLGAAFELDCVVLTTDTSFSPTSASDCTLDPTAPVLEITSPGEGSTVTDAQLTVRAEAGDPESSISSVTFIPNGDASNALVVATEPYSAEFRLANGPNTVEVIAANGAGLTTSEVVRFEVDAADLSPPVLSVTAPISEAVLTTDSVVVAASADDPESSISQVEFILDGDAQSSVAVLDAPYEATFTNLSEGSHTAEVRATNEAGLTAVQSVSFSFAAPDTTPPLATIIAPAQSAILPNSNVTIEVDASDPDSDISSVEFTLDDASSTSIVISSAPYVHTYALDNGTHTVDVVATNGAGLESTESVSFTVEAPDTTPPELEITTPLQSETITDDFVAIRAIADDPESDIVSVQFVLDGIADDSIIDSLAPYEGLFASLSEGDHVVEATALNSAGLTTAETVAFTIELPDTTAPIVAITAPGENEIATTQDVTVEVAASDPESGIASVELILDDDTSNAVVLTSTPYAAQYELPNGSHKVEAVATNGDGLVSTETLNFEVNSPATEPTLFNFAPNESFEFNPGTDYFSTGRVSGDLFWDSQIAHTGTHSLKIVGNTQPRSGGRAARWMSRTPRLPVNAGTEYTLSAFVKTENVIGNAEIAIAFWNSTRSFGSIKWTTNISLDGTTDWTEIELSRIAPANTEYARIEMRLKGTGTVWFDDVTFTDGTTRAANFSLLTNPQPI